MFGIHVIFPTASHERVPKRDFGAKGSGCVSISSTYCPNRLMCSVRYGLRRRTASGGTHTPSCCRAESALVISTTLCNMIAFATKSRYLIRFSCSTGSPVCSTGPKRNPVGKLMRGFDLGRLRSDMLTHRGIRHVVEEKPGPFH